MEILVTIAIIVILFVIACCTTNSTLNAFMITGILFASIYLLTVFGISPFLSFVLGVVVAAVCFFITSVDTESSSTDTNAVPASVTENPVYKESIAFINFCYKNTKYNDYNDYPKTRITLMIKEISNGFYDVSGEHQIFDDTVISCAYESAVNDDERTIGVYYKMLISKRNLTAEDQSFIGNEYDYYRILIGKHPKLKLKQTDRIDFLLKANLGNLQYKNVATVGNSIIKYCKQQFENVNVSPANISRNSAINIISIELTT